MDRSPLVSIVTPSFNQAAYLEETILSVLDQDYPNLEYIVIDGGSSDGSLEIIQKYQSQLAAWISEPDQGQSDAINKGFDLAQGEILAWLNSDDYYFPGAIRAAVAYLMDHPLVGMVYGDADVISEDGSRIRSFDARPSNYQRLMKGRGNIPQPAAFWRKDLMVKVGPLDTSFSFAMDYDLWLRFARVAEIHYIPQRWAAFRMHSSAKTSQSFDQFWPEMLLAYRKQGGGTFSIFMYRYLLRRIFGPTWHRMRKLLSRK